MSVLALAVDVGVAVLLVALVARVMFTRDLFEATVLFITFGLTLSLAWVRLGAPDVALAEAALGAGVTGALFLNAFQRLSRVSSAEERSPERAVVGFGVGRGLRDLRLLVLGTAAVLAPALLVLIAGTPPSEPALARSVAERLPETAVSNPVTGVLMGFRAFDTLFEVVALVVAMTAVWSLDRGSRAFARHPGELGDDPVLHSLARIVTPVAGVTAVYLVWSGTHGSGGAFQGGALLAGVGVLLAAAGLVLPVTSATPLVRGLAVLGLYVFIGVGLAGLQRTGVFLAYPQSWAYTLTLVLEGVLAISIAVVLVELFVDVPAVPEADPRLARVDPTGDPLGRALAAILPGSDEREGGS